jgi:hypothetical protein
MASIKKFNGNLVIQTPVKTGTNANITLDSDFVIVTGNLNVRGNTTIINSNTQTITDNILTLNSGETGNGVSTLGTTSGIEIDRGIAPGGNVQLRWNETAKLWQVSGVTSGSPGDGTKYSNIAISTTGGTTVFDDKAPVLGGNLNSNGYTIYANTNVIISGNLQINNTLVAPTAVTNTTVLYAQTPNSGQSGLYVVNQASTNEELVTKRRAFGFSLIL